MDNQEIAARLVALEHTLTDVLAEVKLLFHDVLDNDESDDVGS